MKIILKNKKAYFNYFISEKYEAGISLKGTEVKSICNVKFNIEESYITIKKGEIWIINMNISPFEQGNINNHDPIRNRKLLMHKKEIKKLEVKCKRESFTLVPTMVYFKNKNIKVEIGLAKGKKIHDKRETIKERDIKRKIEKY